MARNNGFENVLILQGGGSLGAFGCAVFKALAETRVEIDTQKLDNIHKKYQKIKRRRIKDKTGIAENRPLDVKPLVIYFYFKRLIACRLDM
jgi:hypothetical protein